MLALFEAVCALLGHGVLGETLGGRTPSLPDSRRAHAVVASSCAKRRSAATRRAIEQDSSLAPRARSQRQLRRCSASLPSAPHPFPKLPIRQPSLVASGGTLGIAPSLAGESVSDSKNSPRRSGVRWARAGHMPDVRWTYVGRTLDVHWTHIGRTLDAHWTL